MSSKNSRPSELIVLERCQTQLRSLTDLKSVLEVRDKAAAVKHYLKAKGDARESQNSAAGIASLAEARAGQLIKEGQKAGTIAKQGQPKKEKSQAGTLLLDDLGIKKNESSRLQLAAVVLDEDPHWFDTYRDECTKEDRDFTQQAIVRRGKQLRNAGLKKKTIVVPKGKYDVIVIDPPWPMEKIEREVRPNQADFDYPTMTEEELAELKIPCAADCHVWVWTTHRFLPMALRLIPVWKLKYVCTFVWHKAGGFQPVGLPQFNCEFALYCRAGSPAFRETKTFSTCFTGKRRTHSQKPQEFYDTIIRVCGLTKRHHGLDMFNRNPIDCFDGWGKEA